MGVTRGCRVGLGAMLKVGGVSVVKYIARPDAMFNLEPTTPDKAERVILSQTNARATLQPLGLGYC